MMKDSQDGSMIPPSPAVQAVEKAFNDGIGFDEVMKERTRIRREKEEYNMAELTVHITRLEEALAAETKRRVDATVTLEETAREQVQEMEDRLRQQLEQDNERLNNRMKALESRLTVLENQWDAESQSQIDTIQQLSSTFSKSLVDLQNEQDIERKARAKREGQLVGQMETHAVEFEDRWLGERRDRLEKMIQLESKVRTLEGDHETERLTFQSRVDRELSLLKQELDDETKTRQTMDDELVQALNTYTRQVQHALSNASSN